MLNTLGIMLAGVFGGAVAMEIINRKYPGAMGTLYTKARGVTSEVKEAFNNGYENTKRPKTTAV